MSLVGTRPPTLDEFMQYEEHHKRRLSLKPGITGMWQVSGRSEIQNFEDVVKLDLEYIDNGFANTTPGNGHLNEVGHKIMADAIIDYLEEVDCK